MIKNKKGFSIIELMIGILILSSTIVMIVGLYTYLFKVSQKGVDLTAGTAVGEKVLEEFIQEAMTKPIEKTDGGHYAKKVSALTSGNVFVGSKSVNSSKFYYVIEVSGDLNNSDYRLMKVDATIRWWDNTGGLDSLQTKSDAQGSNEEQDGYNPFVQGTGSEHYNVSTQYNYTPDATSTPGHIPKQMIDLKTKTGYGFAHTRITKLIFAPPNS